MTLLIRYECPLCHSPMLLNLQDFAPGKRQRCKHCHTPARMTKDGLERFSEDVRQYCLS